MLPKDMLNGTYSLQVGLTPINAKANTVYSADLYEKGVYRASINVEWGRPQINVTETTIVQFPLTQSEYEAYYSASLPQTLHEASDQLKGIWHSNWWKNTFSVKVLPLSAKSTMFTPTNSQTIIATNPTPMSTNISSPPMATTTSQTYRVGMPTLTLTYPNGGEIWHVGDLIKITWTSTNLPENTAVNISLSLASTQPYSPSVILHIGSTTNTGSFTWTVTNNSVTTNATGGYAKVLVETMGASAISAKGFAITQ